MIYRADVGSMKGASANVESVFSGVKRLLGDFAATMSPEVLELYVFIHYNYLYEWLRPTTQEIVDAYLATYGPDAMADDNSSDEEDDAGRLMTWRLTPTMTPPPMPPLPSEPRTREV